MISIEIDMENLEPSHRHMANLAYHRAALKMMDFSAVLGQSMIRLEKVEN